MTTPLLSTNWSQENNGSYSFNKFCPGYPGSSKTLTGCVATAYAQILYYWIQQGYEFNLSLTADDPIWFLDTDVSTDTDDAFVINWEDAPYYCSISLEGLNDILSEITIDSSHDYDTDDDIAALNFFCSVAAGSLFRTGADRGTGTIPGTGFFDRVGFKSYCKLGNGQNPVLSDYEFYHGGFSEIGYSLITENLAAGEVIFISISNPNHVAVLDGYDPGSDKVHINMGWGDGGFWCTRKELNAYSIDYVILNLHPECESRTLTISEAQGYGKYSLLGTLLEANAVHDGVSTICFAPELKDSVISINHDTNLSIQTDVVFQDIPVAIRGERTQGLAINTLFGMYQNNVTIRNISGSIAITREDKGNYADMVMPLHVFEVSEMNFSIESLTGVIAANTLAGAVAINGSGKLILNLDGGGIFAGSYRDEGSTFSASVETVINELQNFSDHAGELSPNIQLACENAVAISFDAYSTYTNNITLSHRSLIAGNIELSGNSVLKLNSGSRICGSVDIQNYYYYSPVAEPENHELHISTSSVIDGTVSGNFNEISISIDSTVPDQYLIRTGNFSVDHISLILSAPAEGNYRLLQNYNQETALTLRDNNGKEIAISGNTPVFYRGYSVHTTVTDQSLSLNISVWKGDAIRLHNNGTCTGAGNEISNAQVAGDLPIQKIEVTSGGIINQAAVSRTGEIEVYSGGIIQSAGIFEEGNVLLQNGGTASGTTIHSGGTLHVYSGAAASNTTVQRYGGLGVGDGAVTYNTVIDYAGELKVWGGGRVVNSEINEWGAILLMSGATAEQTVINGNGALHVYSGAVASSTTVLQNGGFGVGDGATTYDTVIDVAGEVKVWGGGTVHRSQIKQYGAIILMDGAAANETTIYAEGALHIFAGATAYSTRITTGAGLGIGGEGILYGSILEYRADMTFYENAKLRGWNDIAGSIITSGGVDAVGASLNLDLSGRTTGDDVLIDNLANIYSANSYSARLAADQAAGSYLLAGGAWNFNAPLTLYIGDTEIGVAAPETAVLHDNKSYSLRNESGILKLDIAIAG